jgi:hypothetical protein
MQRLNENYLRRNAEQIFVSEGQVISFNRYRIYFATWTVLHLCLLHLVYRTNFSLFWKNDDSLHILLKD